MATWQSFTPVDRVLIVCVLATLLALVADYRLGAAPVDELVPTTPFVENEGRETVFLQVIGWHSLVWLAGGAAVLTPRYRRGLISFPAVLLLAMALGMIAITAATTRVDSLTLESFFGVCLPLASMVALVLHPQVSQAALRTAAWTVAFSAAVVTLGTVAKQMVVGSLDRLGIVFFGPTTSTGPVLAALAVLVVMLLPHQRPARAAGLGVFVVLVGGVAFTQSRAAAVALLVGLAIASLRARNVPGWVFLLGVIFALGLLTLAPRSLLSATQSTSFKAENITHHWRLFLERPSFGYGVSKQALPASAGADNTLLAIANGVGAYGVAAFLGAWCYALAGLQWRHAALGGAVLAVYVMGWFGGGEILFQIPVTNLLPLALACALARAAGQTVDLVRIE